MLPKDLVNLIEKYNEVGIFFNFNGYLHWVGKKRTEKWCICYYDKIQYLNGVLLASCAAPLNYFGQLSGIKFYSYYHNLRVNFHECFNEYYNLYYNYENLNFVSHPGQISLPSKRYAMNGFKLLSMGKMLYYFGNFNNNEKFDIEKQTWSAFSNYPKKIMDVNIFEDIFYILMPSGNIIIYDPKLDKYKRTIFYFDEMKSI